MNIDIKKIRNSMDKQIEEKNLQQQQILLLTLEFQKNQITKNGEKDKYYIQKKYVKQI